MHTLCTKQLPIYNELTCGYMGALLLTNVRSTKTTVKTSEAIVCCVTIFCVNLVLNVVLANESIIRELGF